MNIWWMIVQSQTSPTGHGSEHTSGPALM